MPIHNILECINNFPVVLFDFFIFGIYGIKTHETIYDMFCDDAFDGGTNFLRNGSSIVASVLFLGSGEQIGRASCRERV